MKRQLTLSSIALIVWATSTLAIGAAAPGSTVTPTPDRTQLQLRLRALKIPFVPNAGQWDRRAAFAAHTFAGTLFVTTGGQLVYSLPGKAIDERETGTSPAPGPHRPRALGAGLVLTETLVDSRGRALALAPRGLRRQETKVSYFVGDQTSLHRNALATFEQVRLGELAPGIAVQLRATGSNVEKIFTVAPGRNPRSIRVRLQGAERLELGPLGELIVHTGNGPLVYTAPLAYQDGTTGARSTVPVRYALAADQETYGFVVGKHDQSRPLIIDPLLQSTYLGGSGEDYVSAMALDANGNVFIAGYTQSANFPGTTGGRQPASGGSQDAFVAKLNGSLTALAQATYLGGSLSDTARAIALDAAGNVFVGGGTFSSNFPAGAIAGTQPLCNSCSAGFVAKLNNNLTTLIQATFVGGLVNAIALDAAGNVFVGGATSSITLPGTAGGAIPANIYGGVLSDGFLVKLNNGLTALIQATYVGDGAGQSVYAIALDASGNVFTAGDTASGAFPGTSGAAQAVHGGGGSDAFVAKLNSGLTALFKATYLGGNGADGAYAMALDAGGNVFVTGYSSSTNLPGTTGGPQPTPGGAVDGFVAKLNNGLTTLAQATYLGGTADDVPYAIAIDESDTVFVAGYAHSANFPGTSGGMQPAIGGFNDAFVARLTNGLTTLTQATYLGGNRDDGARAMALDASGNLIVAGYTQSANFPAAAGGAQATFGGGSGFGVGGDGFVATVTPALTSAPSPTRLTAFEFYNTTLRHYFRTGSAAEAQAIDAGAAGPGWARTGDDFSAYATGTGPGSDVCRFYYRGANSHFYTADATECQSLKAQNPANDPDFGWKFEELAFRIQVPATGACPSGTVAIHRAYNNRGLPVANDANHRFTTSLANITALQALGWTYEGVAFCAPA